MNKADYAIQYAKKGLYVIPLRENSKIPTMKHKDQPALPIKRLYNIFNSHPELNIGIKTVDLFVIDVDSPEHGNHNNNGFKSLQDIPADLLPPTLVGTSPSGGRHYFYLKRNGEPSHSVINWRAGVDVVAGRNNLVVVPPSTKNGGRYAWLNPNQPIASAPAKLIDLIKQQTSDFIKTDYTHTNGKHWTGTLLDEIVQGAPEGRRNDYLTRLTGKLFITGADGETVYELLQVANNHSQPPLGMNEVNTIFNSILEREVVKRERSR